MIIQTIDTASAFRTEFHRAGRGNHFTYEGCTALFNYLEENYASENYELDVVSICCDFMEYTLEELIKQYRDENETDDELILRLNESTLLIEVDGGSTYIIQAF
jgi:hypothetical protein